MEPFRGRIRDVLARATGLAPDAVVLESPRGRTGVDLAFPCFALGKERRRPPAALASEIAAACAGIDPSISARAQGPYVNFAVDRAALAAETLPSIAAAGDRWGGSEEGRGKTVVLDYSSPNIAKPFSVGHLRSTVIGAALARLFALRGYRVVGINHLGDWGAQFGRLLAAFARWGEPERLERDPIPHLHELYVRFHEEEERDGEGALAAEARAKFKALESGAENEERALWRRLSAISLREFDRIYARLGVRFDAVAGESAYEADLAATIERFVAAGVAKTSEGALVVDLEDEGMPPLILRTAEGTTLYATRDLAAVFRRKAEYDFSKAVYVVGSDQRLHFRQLRAALRKLGVPWWDDLVHVDFGLVLDPGGKMRTRGGNVVLLDEVLEAAAERVRAIVREKNPDLADPESVASAVGVGAIVFHDLKTARVKDVLFDWDAVLNFDGETGPYLQYAHARFGSILRKAGIPPPREGIDWERLRDAGDLVAALARFPDAVADACARYEPSILAGYLLDLGKSANAFYRDHRVIGEPEPVFRARLLLVDALRVTMRSGLGLLGVGAPEEM